jgi:hypothetical protein
MIYFATMSRQAMLAERSRDMVSSNLKQMLIL